MIESGQDWEEQARNWIAWARRPGFDSYWRYREEFFELVPAPGRATLDIGCGEGRVSRDLAERGHSVIGVDASPTLVAAARKARPEGDYRLADAAGLPFPDDAFDLVVAYNVLMDVADLPGAIREAGRVLAPGGRFCVAITHPMTNSGQFTEDRRMLPVEAYFETRRVRSRTVRDGLEMVFQGWSHPLSNYTRPLEEAGLLIEAIREPVAVNANGVAQPIPYHFWLRALRPAS